MSVEQIRADREMREARAAARAAMLPPGEYFAYNNFVCEQETHVAVVECETHWDACLVMLAAARGAQTA